MSAPGRFATVTEIAAGLGFVELGRFSVEFRRMFGASLPETLRRTFRDPGSGNRDLNDRVTF
jgi:AraC-like DNA-binding protein